MSMRGWKRAAIVLLMTFATVQFIRSYIIINKPYLNAAMYEAGLERRPYQSRILMSYVMKYADASEGWSRMAGHLQEPLNRPSTLAVVVIGLVSILCVAIVVWRWYLLCSPTRAAPWLPFALVLWMVYVTYLARFQEAIYFPYDLLDVALFTAALFLCFAERYVLLGLLLPLACLNRETIVVLLLPLSMNMWMKYRDGKRGILWREVTMIVLFGVVLIASQIYFSDMFSHNASELGAHIAQNVRFLEAPQMWSQILSGAGFLLPVPFLWFGAMPNERMRLYSLLVPVWVAAMFVFGLLPESRVFGELIGFLAVYCTMQFETKLFARIAAV